mgnify:CR=1 FL=1
MNYEEKYKLEGDITKAILRGEDIFTFIGKDDIGVYQLPEAQRTGTFYQRETYARLKAKEMINGK